MSANDFVITIHALERFAERFPKLAAELGAPERQGEFIHGEVMEALDAGRHNTVPPIELAPHGADRWQQRTPGSYVTWTKDKRRGYSILEDPKEGMLVTTVLIGDEHEQAMRKLRVLNPGREAQG